MCKRSWIAPAIAGSFFLAIVLAGCGNSSPAYDPSAYSRDYAGMPTSSGSQPAVGIPQAYGMANAPTGAAGANGSTGVPNGAANALASNEQLTAIVSSVQNGSVFGLGDFVATVLVSNPSNVTLTGTLTVTFMDSGQPTTDVQTMDLSLAAGQSQNFTFTDTTWSTDNAVLHITTQPPDPGSAGMGQAMGAGSAFGL